MLNLPYYSLKDVKSLYYKNKDKKNKGLALTNQYSIK